MFWIALILYILGVFLFSVILIVASAIGNITTRTTFNKDECYQAFVWSIFWPFLTVGLFIVGIMNNITKEK